MVAGRGFKGGDLLRLRLLRVGKRTRSVEQDADGASGGRHGQRRRAKGLDGSHDGETN